MSQLFKDVGEVRDFIVWCRGQRIQALEVGEVKVSFSPMAFVDPPPKRNEAEGKQPKRDPGTGYTEDELYP